jgi:hypothetical protein
VGQDKAEELYKAERYQCFISPLSM